MRSFNYEKKMMKCASLFTFIAAHSAPRLLSAHPHPNIITCYGACSADETPALVMEYIPKVSFALQSALAFFTHALSRASISSCRTRTSVRLNGRCESRSRAKSALACITCTLCLHR